MRLRELRKARGWSMKQLGEMVGCSESTISLYENGRREPGFETLLKLGEILGVSVDYLLGNSASAVCPPLPKDAIPFDAHAVAPLLGTVRAGLPMYAEENIEAYLPIRQHDGAQYFWLRVTGDSMNAAGLDEGDEILVRAQSTAEDGQVAVVLVNGDEATVKVFRQEENIVVLTPRSYNPIHQPQIYNLKDTSITVAGIVIECRKVLV